MESTSSCERCHRIHRSCSGGSPCDRCRVASAACIPRHAIIKRRIPFVGESNFHCATKSRTLITPSAIAHAKCGELDMLDATMRELEALALEQPPAYDQPCAPLVAALTLLSRFRRMFDVVRYPSAFQRNAAGFHAFALRTVLSQKLDMFQVSTAADTSIAGPFFSPASHELRMSLRAEVNQCAAPMNIAYRDPNIGKVVCVVNQQYADLLELGSIAQAEYILSTQSFALLMNTILKEDIALLADYSSVQSLQNGVVTIAVQPVRGITQRGNFIRSQGIIEHYFVNGEMVVTRRRMLVLDAPHLLHSTATGVAAVPDHIQSPLAADAVVTLQDLLWSPVPCTAEVVEQDHITVFDSPVVTTTGAVSATE